MQRKVGIVTIDDPVNYGNRLQNFAMQEMLKSLGYEPHTIRVLSFRDLYYLWPQNKKYCIKQYLYSVRALRYIVYKIKGKRIGEEQANTKNLGINSERSVSFEKFNQTFIQHTDSVIRSEPIEKRFYRNYKYLIAGSDQVWNPTYGLPKCAMYLRFAPKRKRIAIAASFGISEIPQEHLKIVKKYLNGMKYISVREESGQKIVKELTGRECDLIMDPTLMVFPDIWGKIEKYADAKLPQRYMLTYFLGEVSEEKRKYIQNIAHKKGCELIWMNSEEDRDVYNWGPENFLKAIRNCECFFTDSFHGCVFSILFHRQFLVFQREGDQRNMFDRIHTLLSRVDLENQIVKSIDDRMVEDKTIAEPQFEKADFVLEKERARVQKILKKVLS